MKKTVYFLVALFVSSCAYFYEFWEPSDVTEAMKPKALFDNYLSADKLNLQ